MSTRTRRTRRGPLSLALAAALAAPSLAAQTWVALTPGAPAGAPAEIVYDAAASTPTDSFFDVLVPGFWVEDVEPGDGATYQRIEVPGLGRVARAGAPDLPAARIDIAAASFGFSDVIAVQARDLAPHAVTLTPAPFGLDGLLAGDGPRSGRPDRFVLDALVYGGAAVFPDALSTRAAPVETRLGSIPAATHEVHPFRWDPVTGELTASSHVRVHYHTAGAPVPQPAITRDRAATAAATFENWRGLRGFFELDDIAADLAADDLEGRDLPLERPRLAVARSR